MTVDERDTRKARRKRLGLLIRVGIYIPLLAFFGWRALEHRKQSRAAADDAFRGTVDSWLDADVPGTTITLPTGEQLRVLTPEEAASVGVKLGPEADSPTAATGDDPGQANANSDAGSGSGGASPTPTAADAPTPGEAGGTGSVEAAADPGSAGIAGTSGGD